MLAIALVIPPWEANAQTLSGAIDYREVFAGSELENYLRYQRTIDTATHQPWSLRPFSPATVNAMLLASQAGPWQTRHPSAPDGKNVDFALLPVTISARFNTGFPYGFNDGPIWAGRGLTTSAQGGFYARVGPLSLTVAPIVFRAENSHFPLAVENSCPPCADPRYATTVDLPERFGITPYQRIDPGQSTLRLDGLGVAVGATTANEWWGPAQIYPYLLGNNAPGFPHVFLGTGKPLPIFIGRLSARVIFGRLDQSDYSPVKGAKYATDPLPGRVRFASGVMTVFEPRGLTGLEVGIGAFYHSSWPASGIPRSYITRPLHGPLTGFYQSGASKATVTTNVLASGFARWVFPHSGLEVYGEYGNEDSHADFRGQIQEPDYTRAYSLGLRKVFLPGPADFSAIQFELMNYQLPELARYHGLGATYVHNRIPQGHTNRGQLLGAPLGVVAAAGSTLQWDRYSVAGRTSFAWVRTVSQESGSFFQFGQVNPRAIDVSHAFRMERVMFLRAIDLTSGVTVLREFNRNFREDVWNLNALVQASYRFH